ncbi:MAG: hypothetical protein RL154_983 [Pseudomonadota bacterium]|jgi:hypothetical protein
MKFTSKLRVSIAVACVVATTSSFAADSLEAAFAKGKVNGNLQAWYINDSFTAGAGSPKTGTAGNPKARGQAAVGGVLSYVTDPYYGINGGATFISSNLLGQNPNAGNNQGTYTATSSSAVSSIDYNSNTLSEAYIQGVYGKTTAKVGEQILDTPLATSLEGARIFLRTFKAGVLTNADIPDTTLVAAYVNGMQTSSSAMYGGSVPGSLGGTNNAQASINLGYQGMDTVAFGDLANAITGGANNPVWALAAINKSLPGLTAQAWFYQATNVLNAWWFQGDYKYSVNNDIGLFAGAQFLNEGGTGTTQSSFKNGLNSTKGGITTNALAPYCNGGNMPSATKNVPGNVSTCSSGISSNYFAFKVGGSYENLTLSAAYSNTSYKDSAAMDGSLIMPWGGNQTKLYTSTMIGNATAGGTQATLWKAEYKFDGVLQGLYAAGAYGLYAAKAAAQDAFYTANIYGYKPSDIVGNMGYSGMYGEIKYDLNKQTSFRWQIEQDTMMGQVAGFPKAALESRLMGIYKF